MDQELRLHVFTLPQQAHGKGQHTSGSCGTLVFGVIQGNIPQSRTHLPIRKKVQLQVTRVCGKRSHLSLQEAVGRELQLTKSL